MFVFVFFFVGYISLRFKILLLRIFGRLLGKLMIDNVGPVVFRIWEIREERLLVCDGGFFIRKCSTFCGSVRKRF